jgi:hypothetical protein
VVELGPRRRRSVTVLIMRLDVWRRSTATNWSTFTKEMCVNGSKDEDTKSSKTIFSERFSGNSSSDSYVRLRARTMNMY